MAKHIFYDKTLIATIENGKIIFDSVGIEKSGMPLSWKPRIECCLINALPEGIRFESLVVLASKDGSSPNSHVELIPYVDDLPGRFSVENTSAYSNGKQIRRYMPLPNNLPETEVQSNLSAAFLRPQSEIRRSARPSFSGYQDKFVANLSVEDMRLVLNSPKPNERGNVIVKPGSPNYPYIAENEYACMKMAQSMGLDVPRVFLFRQLDAGSVIERQRRHFIIERFDYALNQDGEPEKLEITDIASLMGLDSETKYNKTTEELFQTAKEYLSTEDMKNFADMYFFGILVCNSDMHTKNFSFVIDPESHNYRPTPLYDCLCTAIYGFSDTLALSLGGTERPKMKSVISFMESFLSVNEMRKLTEGVKLNIGVSLDTVFDLKNPKEASARNCISTAVINRTTTVLKELEAFDRI